MGRHYLQLLNSLIANPEMEIARVRMLDEADGALIEGFNETDHRLNETTLPPLFEKQVTRTPDATALICGERHFTYREINAKANRLAHFLMAEGIGPEDIVAIATDRSADLITALLGTIKAGAAWLPLDPELPAARVSSILDHAAPKCLLTNALAISSLPATGPGISIYDIGECADSDGGLSDDPVPGQRTRPLNPDSPAYVIYTSGSTGAPKGVVGLQAGMANRIEWMRNAFPYDSEERVLARTSLSFIDGSTELLSALSSGATVVLADLTVAKDPAAIARTISLAKIRRATVVPGLLRALLEEPDSDRLSSCKLWISSGAALPEQCVRRFHKVLPYSRLVNLYGCTECSGDSTFSECREGSVTGGRPIWNTRLYIVNEAMQLNPVGVTGELCIAGAGTGREYLHQPELTGERFLLNPFAESGENIYRTGDLARWRSDGNIDLLGRADRQVKIRGRRIEPGEVEAALRNLPSVLEAVVVSDTSTTGELQLAACVVPSGTIDSDASSLRSELLRVLPDYMIPSVFHFVPSIPTLFNGKPDLGALPDLHREVPRGSGSPRSGQEEVLSALFREVLGMENVGIEDDFFEMGGHSLSATRLINRVREKFGLDLTLRALFETGSVANLCDKFPDVFGMCRKRTPRLANEALESNRFPAS